MPDAVIISLSMESLLYKLPAQQTCDALQWSSPKAIQALQPPYPISVGPNEGRAAISWYSEKNQHRINLISVL